MQNKGPNKAAVMFVYPNKLSAACVLKGTAKAAFTKEVQMLPKSQQYSVLNGKLPYQNIHTCFQYLMICVSNIVYYLRHPLF